MTDLPITTRPGLRPAPIAACALVRPHPSAATFYPFEAYDARIEFLPALDDRHCFVRVAKARRDDTTGQPWGAWDLEQARAFHRALRAGNAPIYTGQWVAADARARVAGVVDVTARRTSFQWGDGAQRVEAVDLPGGIAPVVVERGRAYALRVVYLTDRDAPRRMVHWEPL